MDYFTFKTEKLQTFVFPNRQIMGEEAADRAAKYIERLLCEKDEINILFAAAPSQNEFLESLREKSIPWNRINALHMDEYVGLPSNAPQAFGNYLREHIFECVPFKSIHYLYQENETPEMTCKRYEGILKEYPLDIVFMGIGENGHIAFNDPHVALFDDPQSVKVIKLDEICRMQQVHDGCFHSLEEVPQMAITVTIPVILSAQYLFCMVPGSTKANAIHATLLGDIHTTCPASILRTHPNAFLFCDKDSASLITQ
jgi:glucosamine-6-phosphate deaminase